MAYAERTTVPASKTKSEIEELLIRHGARRYQTGWDDERGIALISFECEGRRVRFSLVLPTLEEYSTKARHDQATRAAWRALLLVIKAKIESIESGIESFEDAFLPQIVLPDNRTVADWIGPQLADSYRLKSLPPLLPLEGVTFYLPPPKP